jgi:hypothetical protein
MRYAPTETIRATWYGITANPSEDRSRSSARKRSTRFGTLSNVLADTASWTNGPLIVRCDLMVLLRTAYEHDHPRPASARAPVFFAGSALDPFGKFFPNPLALPTADRKSLR